MLYGQPKNIDELIRYLIPGQKGLWEHTFVQANKIKSENFDREFWVVCDSEENDKHWENTSSLVTRPNMTIKFNSKYIEMSANLTNMTTNLKTDQTFNINTSFKQSVGSSRENAVGRNKLGKPVFSIMHIF